MPTIAVFTIVVCLVIGNSIASDDVNTTILSSLVSSASIAAGLVNGGGGLLKEGVPGPPGFIFHRTSGKAIHPFGGSASPSDDTPLVTHSLAGQRRLEFRFIPVEGFGHFGYIEHVSSGAVVQPLGGSGTPRDNTRLVLHRSRHYGALFTFDEQLEHIVHISGTFWRPYRGVFVPIDNERVVVHQETHPAAGFYFGNATGQKLSPFSSPNLSGKWELLKVFVNPLIPITYTQTYREGRSTTTTSTIQHSWSISVEASAFFFSASAEYSGFMEYTTSETFTSEHESSIQLHVPAGQTIAFWQFVYRMEQYGEGFTFKSNVIGTSNSVNVEPVLD